MKQQQLKRTNMGCLKRTGRILGKALMVPLAAGLLMLGGCDKDVKKKVPPCARLHVMPNATAFFNTPDTVFNHSVKRRFNEVSKRYNHLDVKPKVKKGILKGIYVVTTRYGSEDRGMCEWFNYVATGVKPR